MEIFKTFIEAAKAEHPALIEQLAVSSAAITFEARFAFIDRLVGEMKALLPSTIRYADVEQYLTDLAFTDLLAVAIAVNGPRHTAMECAKAKRPDGAADAATITDGSLNHMSQSEGAMVNGWLASLSSAFHLCKAQGQTHDAEKIAEVLRYLGSAPAAQAAPEVVVEMEGGIITVVDSNVPVTVTFLDADTEGGDKESIATVGDSQFYVSVHAVAAGQCRSDYVERVSNDVATHFESALPEAPSPI